MSIHLFVTILRLPCLHQTPQRFATNRYEICGLALNPKKIPIGIVVMCCLTGFGHELMVTPGGEEGGETHEKQGEAERPGITTLQRRQEFDHGRAQKNLNALGIQTIKTKLTAEAVRQIQEEANAIITQDEEQSAPNNKNWDAFYNIASLSPNTVARFPFIKLLQTGAYPRLPWVGFIPAVLEEVFPFMQQQPERVGDLSNADEQPLLLEEMAEQRGRFLFQQPQTSNIEQQDTPEKIAHLSDSLFQLMRLYEAGIDVCNPTAEEKSRWDIWEKSEQLRKKIEDLKALQSQSMSTSDRYSTVSGRTFASSLLSGTSSQMRQEKNPELKNLKKEKKEVDQKWASLAVQAEEQRPVSNDQRRAAEDVRDYWQQIDGDALVARNWAYDLTRWNTLAEWKALKEDQREMAKEAKKRWSSLADLHEVMDGTDSSEERAHLKKELALSDEIIIDHLHHTFLKASATTKSHHQAIDEWRGDFLSHCFEKADQAYAAFNKAKGDGRPFKTIQDLHKQADLEEEKARQEYARKALIKGLQSLLTGMLDDVIAAWEQRVELSQQEANCVQASYRRQEPSAQTETEQVKVARAKAIADADQAALERVKREIARLSEIEKTATAALEITDLATKLQIEAAAFDHAQGNTAMWQHLPTSWKGAYHQAVEAANKKYRSTFQPKNGNGSS